MKIFNLNSLRIKINALGCSALIIFSLCAANARAADFTTDQAGTTSAQFLKLAVGARPVAMGEAYTSVADDVNSIYWNPAGLLRINNSEATAMRAQWVEGISFNWAAYARKCLGGCIGVGVEYLTSGDIASYDNLGNNLNQSFNTSDMALNVAYAKVLWGIPAGINIKILRSTLENESATGIAADLGIQKQIFGSTNEKIDLGVTVQNMGLGLKFMQQSAPLPLIIKTGMSAKLLNDNLILATDLDFPADYEVNAHLGAEYRYHIGKIDLLPRIGFKTTTLNQMDVLSGLAVGFGVALDGININYAWVPCWEFGDTHRIDAVVKFGYVAAAAEPMVKKEPEPGVDLGEDKEAAVCVDAASQHINFDFGSSSVKKDEIMHLDMIAALISKYDPDKVRIIGHCDALESKIFGNDLAKKRANFIKEYLITKDVPEDKMIAEGNSGGEPENTAVSADETAKNRNVSFTALEEKLGTERSFGALAAEREKYRLDNMQEVLRSAYFDENEYKKYEKKINKIAKYFNEGRALLKKNKCEEAIGKFEEVLKIDPMHSTAKKYIVAANEELKKNEKKPGEYIEKYEEVFKCDPKHTAVKR